MIRAATGQAGETRMCRNDRFFPSVCCVLCWCGVHQWIPEGGFTSRGEDVDIFSDVFFKLASVGPTWKSTWTSKPNFRAWDRREKRRKKKRKMDPLTLIATARVLGSTEATIRNGAVSFSPMIDDTMMI
jgi:hypothetical protein